VLGRKRQCVLRIYDSGAAVGVSPTLPLFDRRQGERAALQVEAALARVQRETLIQEAHAQIDGALAEARALREAEAALAEAPPSERLFVVGRGPTKPARCVCSSFWTPAAARSRNRSGKWMPIWRHDQAEVRLHRAMGIEP
jgi:hypothetical protein